MEDDSKITEVHGTPGRPRTDNLLATTIDGRYLVEKELGRGGIGAVYLARDRKLLDKPVVVKVLLEKSLKEPRVVQKFMQEMEALSRIDHSGVVGVLDTGKMPDGQPYIVMQYIDGMALRDAMRLSPEGMELERAASILRQLGAALDAIHSMGIVHRDLKPENVMLQKADRGEEQVKIVDFGIAKIKDSVIAPSTLTGTGTAGTIIYMSPEQLRAERITAASDIYALGVIAYELVTGRRPFNPETIAHFAEMQRDGVRVKPADLRPRLPAEAERLILSSLSFDAKERPQSAAEFGDSLSRALMNEGETREFQRARPTEIAPTEVAATMPSQPDVLSSKTIPGRFEPAPVPTGDAAFQAGQQKPRTGSAGKIAGIIALVAVLLASGGYFASTRWRSWFPANNSNSANPVAQRSLAYSLTVQKFHNGASYDQAFETSGQEIFENGWKFKMNISSPQAGYLYLLNEGPAANGATTYNVLFPEPKTNGGSAKVSADNKLQTAWMRFDDHQGTERFWIVWSAAPVKELDDVTGVVNAKQKGEISDADQAKAVRDFLDKHSSPKPEVAKDSAGEKTNVKGQGDVLVTNVELKHH